MKGLYVHIPFCEHICNYCDFAKRIPKDRAMILEYIDYLKREYTHKQIYNETFDTIYIGGGTPSMLNIDELKNLLTLFQNFKVMEYTFEINPESYNHEKGLLLFEMGISRISLGVQTFNQAILHYLGRQHTNQMVLDVISDLTQIGFKNISIDLIFGIPNQTLDDIVYDLDMVQNLNIQHISYYSLILEEKTVFHHEYQNHHFKKIDEDLEADMYSYIRTRLKALGFDAYEISNYAKPTFESKHNSLYWTMEPYLAIGAGAFGFDGKYRYQNHRFLPLYFNQFEQNRHLVTMDERMSDTLIFGLRRAEGIDLLKFEKLFKKNVFTIYPELQVKQNQGLIEVVNNQLKLTEKGIFLGNQVFEVFV